MCTWFLCSNQIVNGKEKHLERVLPSYSLFHNKNDTSIWLRPLGISYTWAMLKEKKWYDETNGGKEV